MSCEGRQDRRRSRLPPFAAKIRRVARGDECTKCRVAIPLGLCTDTFNELWKRWALIRRLKVLLSAIREADYPERELLP